MPLKQGSTNFSIGFLRRNWRVLTGYWRSEERVQAYLLLAGVIFFSLAVSAAMVLLAYPSRDMMNAIQQGDLDGFYRAIAWLTLTLLTLSALYVLNTHMQLSTAIHWRRHLLKTNLVKYLENSTFYQMELKEYDVDNPDQRLSEDLRRVTEESLELFARLLVGFATMLGYFGLLWQLSGEFTFVIGGEDVVIPGFLIWVSVSFAMLMTFATHYIARNLIPLNVRLQAVEADFRFRLVRLRENAESIALGNGEGVEQTNLKRDFTNIWQTWFGVLRYRRRLSAAQFIILQVSARFVYIVAAPRVISGEIGLGELEQISMAFGMVNAFFMWIVLNYRPVAEWKASCDRVIALQEAMAAAESDKARSELAYDDAPSNEGVSVSDLTLELPDGDILLEKASVSLAPGENVLIQGASGSGKSTFFRCLAGVWPWGTGLVRRPGGRSMFVPQTTFLPVASLQAAICYPSGADDFDSEEIERLMRICELGDLINQLDTTDNWARVLSGGEKQRISFLRVMLQRPDWLFMDESTSALDPKLEAKIFSALKSELPNTTFVSIGHRKSLKQFHDTTYRIEPETRSINQVPAVAAAD